MGAKVEELEYMLDKAAEQKCDISLDQYAKALNGALKENGFYVSLKTALSGPSVLSDTPLYKREKEKFKSGFQKVAGFMNPNRAEQLVRVVGLLKENENII